MTIYIEEFMWRGRPPGSKQPAAYHVQLGAVDEDAFGRQRLTLSEPMSPAQAEEAGFPLSTIIETINASALKERDEAIAAKEAAEAARDAAVSERAEAERAKEAAEAARDRALEAVAAEPDPPE